MEISCLTHVLCAMSSEQCAQNSDSSLKDPLDIQWFNDPNDAQPLPNHITPAAQAETTKLTQELAVARSKEEPLSVALNGKLKSNE